MSELLPIRTWVWRYLTRKHFRPNATTKRSSSSSSSRPSCPTTLTVNSSVNDAQCRGKAFKNSSSINHVRAKNNVVIGRDDASLVNDPCARDANKLAHPSPRCFDDTTTTTTTLGTCSPPPEPPPGGMCSPTDGSNHQVRFWRNLSLFGALPIVLIATIVIRARVKEESMKPRPEYVPMDHMYRRTKRFPWGDGNHTLFHNPEKNPVPPHGYEVEDPNAVIAK